MLAKENKIMTTLRLTRQAKTLLEKLAESMGISQASVMETAVREMAAKKGIRNETRG